MVKLLRFLLIITIFITTACADKQFRKREYRPDKNQKIWNGAFQIEKNGDTQKSAEEYKKLCYENKYPRGCYDYTRVLFKLNQNDKAVEESIKFVGSYPDETLVQPAVKRLTRFFTATEKYDQAIEVLNKLEKLTFNKEAYSSVIYQKANVYKQQNSYDNEKRELYKIIALDRWGSTLWDNSMWRLINIENELQNSLKEIELIKQFLSAIESSKLIGSYNSSYFDNALLRLGNIYLENDKLDDAYKSFMELSSWSSSSLADDALLEAAKIEKLQNKLDKSCNTLEEIITRYSKTVIEKKAKQLFIEWNCPKMAGKSS
ncbi:MAG: tetratricopeptide repeat protein [Deltaproteobacteria bacterium]|nr:tetratricopeptide repeat protein [Deltaproteobacteria bacterium]